MRVADYISNFIAERGVTHIFMLTGGGAMFLNDALGNHSQITPIFQHHEQACAMAAEGYARITGKLGVINVTTGPGGINAMTGVFGAWTDSVPLLVLSGQVKRETCLGAIKGVEGLRQLGDQEANIIPMVRTITKYAELVLDPNDIKFHLEKAIHFATTGRPGPVWLDIPVDVQSAQINPDTLKGFNPDLQVNKINWVEDQCQFVLDKLLLSKRPVIMAGSGIRAAGAMEEFTRAIRKLGIPIVTAWTHDVIASDDPLFCGRPGTIGTRPGNFVVQNSDCLIVLGSRLNVRQTSYNFSAFASKAFKIQIDVDANELNKPTVKADYSIQCDLKPFLDTLNNKIDQRQFRPTQEHLDWLSWCKKRQISYPAVTEKQKKSSGKINPYPFIESVFNLLEIDDIVVCGNATACIVPYQTAKLKSGQRMFSNSGSASMGHDLPAAIGAYYGALADRGKQQRVICFAGDGSIMLNLQELQTIAHYQIPIKIFILNNQGYLSIRTTQNNFFGRLTGEGPGSGITFPDFVRLGEAFGIPSVRLDVTDYQPKLVSLLNKKGPVLCEVILDETQGFEPRMSSRQLEDGQIVTPPLEDMFPFLEKDELARNMLD